MKKIFITNISMQEHNIKSKYIADNNSLLQYDKEVLFPVSGVLAKTLKKDDNIKVVLVKTNHLEGFCDENEKKLKEEINNINKNIGAKVEFETVDIDYNMSDSSYNELFIKLIDILEEGSELSVDVTFGPKPYMIILFNVLSYAEKFLGMDIAHIIYGKAEFVKNLEKDKIEVTQTKICDLANLYYLNSIFNNISCDKDKIKGFISQLFNIGNLE